MISSFRRISPPPTGSAYQGAEPAGSGQADIIQPPLDDETLQALRDLAVQDERVQNVIDRCQDYPEDLLKMLSRNLDMLDFILEYPEKQGRVFADTIGEVEVGEIPLLLQYDQRWGYGAYGASSVAVSGCGPACLSMVAAGLTGDGAITPYAVAQYAGQEGYYVYGAGTSWSLMSRGASHFGVEGEELPLMKSRMESALREGRPIICVVGPGDFTTSGHFIVITGMRDGQFTVNDPNSAERSSMLWDYETLEPQISNLWAFRAV
ncbi:MAG: secreted protein containing domain of murein hydrolase [Oscillibacter sp.]|nr:secreted protein containing domain of murein hydrolase [Oscillibacter sp.]